MVTIYFVFSQHTCFIQITELRQKMSTYINIMRWDYSPTNPNPNVPTNPNDICVLYASVTESRDDNDKSFQPYFVAQQGSVTYQETSNHNHLSAIIKLNILDCLKIY